LITVKKSRHFKIAVFKIAIVKIAIVKIATVKIAIVKIAIVKIAFNRTTLKQQLSAHLILKWPEQLAKTNRRELSPYNLPDLEE
jgi:hypothetical protein